MVPSVLDLHQGAVEFPYSISMNSYAISINPRAD
jgi:hypothetical protein